MDPAAERIASQPPSSAPGVRPIPTALVLLALALILLLRCGQALSPGPGDPVTLLSAAQASTEVRLRGRLQADLRPAEGRCRGVLELDAGPEPLRGTTALRFASCPDLHEGWRLEVSGRLKRPSPAPHPLLEGPAERLAQRGIHSELRVEQLRVLQRPFTPVADLRRRIADRFLAVAGPEVGGLLAALPEAMNADFRAAGLSHALAASGFHLTVLLGAVQALGRPLGRALRLPLAGGAIALFLLLAGPQASVVRAVVAGALALLILESGRRGRPIGLLALTVVLMLLLRPIWWSDLGFQLSVAATAGLLVSAGPLETLLAGGAASRGRRWLAAAVAVPLAASLWTLPLQLIHFGVVPLYAVPANLAVEPLLTPLTLGAMAMALVALLLPPLLAPLAWLIALPSRLLLLLAHGFAALPMAQWQTGRAEPLLAALFTTALLTLLVPALARRWRHPALALLLLAGLLHLGALRADALLLVHQGPSDLLVARHQGRAALVASRGDPFSCRQASRLAQGLGVSHYDWLLLLDPVAPADPVCWRSQAPLALLSGEAPGPLLPGQSVRSEGLEARALSLDSQALELRAGRQHWLLLPDRQALASLSPQAAQGPTRPAVWLGFAPGAADRGRLERLGAATVWLSGPAPRRPPLPQGWHASGGSGSLARSGG